MPNRLKFPNPSRNARNPKRCKSLDGDRRTAAELTGGGGCTFLNPLFSSWFVNRIDWGEKMDLQTENRIATMLLEEARRLRAEAEKEGVQAYLNKPSVRARPNSRFLTATVLGVQQANRTVEVNEMWRAREKEKELEDKLNRSKFIGRECRNYTESSKNNNNNNNSRIDASCSSQIYDNSNSRSKFDSNSDEDRGFRDNEIEEFLRSRRKRGRGEIGSRMDEPGPYLTSVDQSDEHSDFGFEERRIVGPEKPSFLKSKSSEKKDKKDKSGSKDKKYEKRKEKREEKKKKKKEKKSKGHHHKKRREYDD